MSAARLFEQAKAGPGSIRQEAVRAATAAYTKARAEQLSAWRARLADARALFEAVKEQPGHPEHDRRRAEVTRREIQPSSKPLRDELDRAIRQADAEYHRAVAELRSRFGIKPFA